MNNRTICGILIVAIVAALAWFVLTMPDQRTTGQRIGDAVDALPDVGKASSELQDQTPGQKLGDKVKDAGQNIKDNTANH
jgi:hypothetical protein